MNPQLPDLLAKLPAYLGGHMLVSASALFIGLLISLPLGTVLSRGPKWLIEMVLGAAGVIQTVPSLALLALMVYALHGLTGFCPAFIALTLYSLLPILVNTVIGLKGVDPTYLEAARGLGMSERQLLLRVQVPLAAPVIIGGIRTATVLVVGTATLVTPVGGKCLGNYIFGGLESMNPAATIFGCVVAALLAVVMDQLIHLEEVAARRRSRLLAWLGAVGLLLVFGGGLASPIAQLFDRRASAIIATGPFTEQHILNEVLALHLKARGFRADQRLGMSEGIQVEALKHNQIDCMVNYSGNIWTLVMKQTDVPANPDEVTPLVEAYLANEFGIISLGRLGFQDNYTFVMTAPGLTSLDAPTLDGLACFARQRAKEGKRLKIAADEQFFTRPEWRWVKIKYGLREEDLDLSAMSPALMYGALVSGARDVVVAYSSDGRIPAYGLEQLKDTKKALPPYDALLLVSSKAGRQPGVVEALAPLKDSIDETTMRRATLRVDEEHWTARRAAESLYYEER